MNENSYLSPANIKAQCDAAITKLENDNEATYAIEEKLSAFQEDTQVKSEAFDALKLQMEDYKTVLQTMRTANECDIKDFRFLKIAVGFQELNGGVILEKKRVQMSEKHFNEQKAETYRAKARKAKTATLRFNYNTKVVHYEAMAELEQKLYDAWQEKENQYNGIESLTSGLFTEGTAIRATIENALDNITHAFYDGTYHPDMNAGWRLEIYDIYYNRVFQVSEGGEIVIDFTEVERILKKDAEYITAMEYNMLAMAYLVADDKDLSIFIQYMMKDRHDYAFELKWMQKNDFSVWIIDHEKIEQIISRVENASLKKLSLLQETRASGDNIKVLEYKEQRNVLLQRLTLLNVIDQLVSFDGEYEADCPKFTTKKNKNGDLVLEFLENKTPDEFSQANLLLKSTITITNTENGMSINEKMIDNVKYLFDCRFSQYTLEDYIVDKAEGRIMKNVVDSIPGQGIVAGIGMDLWIGQQQAQRNHEFIEEQYDALSAGHVYSNYDCSANFVDYDMEYENAHKIFVYEGEKTREKIKKINDVYSNTLEIKTLAELLKNKFPPDGLTVEIVLTRPEEVYQFGEELSGDLGEVYRDIVTNKINEMGERK